MNLGKSNENSSRENFSLLMLFKCEMRKKFVIASLQLDADIDNNGYCVPLYEFVSVM